VDQRAIDPEIGRAGCKNGGDSDKASKVGRALCEWFLKVARRFGKINQDNEKEHTHTHTPELTLNKPRNLWKLGCKGHCDILFAMMD
jgi:hypothetical protein